MAINKNLFLDQYMNHTVPPPDSTWSSNNWTFNKSATQFQNTSWASASDYYYNFTNTKGMWIAPKVNREVYADVKSLYNLLADKPFE